MVNIRDRRMQIAQRLRKARDDKDWTQAQLAEALSRHGVSIGPTTIAKIESGKRSIEIVEAQTLADVLDLPWASLYNVSSSQGDDRVEMLRRQAAAMLSRMEKAIGDLQESGDGLLGVVLEWMELNSVDSLPDKVAGDVNEKVQYIAENLTRINIAIREAAAQLDMADPLKTDGSGIINENLTIYIEPLYYRLQDYAAPLDDSGPYGVDRDGEG
ncbi:helix-turn-helix transcriptional regulator [Corynebacterium sp. P7003]|uniref:Helix-turn-helix transcriptional regulator n=1 Tax=Corynebacterium pygosceleis TaxID=2800406 RepID=A0ABT3WWL0_9CORY|nr:helix-turn-helix transcriptional regulator [Corynebacterium pygosceleis]MCX7444391.1 helix-turn-helix transcriptional regulator [Corynebacterium pygosceleis]